MAKSKKSAVKQNGPVVAMEPLGLSRRAMKDVIEALAAAHANTYILYLKTQNYHWNVTGPHFAGLHVLFEQQYIDLRDAVDVLAERLRALGVRAPGSFAEFQKLAILEEDPHPKVKWDAMVSNLAHDHQQMTRLLRDAISLADEASDVSTADILTGRAEVHSKAAWMLGAHLE